MYAQLTYFDGPRSAELVAANEHAARDRIMPAMRAHEQLREQLVAVYNLRRPDGGEVTVVITQTEQALLTGRELIMSMELLPDEDPALLPGPDRAEIYEVTFAESAAMIGQTS